jgi:DNA-directed RNA polymerase specialized sigma24 family protein
MPRATQMASQEATAYAMSADFRRVLAENADDMHLLSFVLTADHTKADECCVCGLDNCAKASCEFRDWARTWTRRIIIRNAVHMLAPCRNHLNVTPESSDPASFEFAHATEADDALASILGLADFERFIFVMSVLEGYPDEDCSVLLGCSEKDVRETRVRALQHVEESYRLRTAASSGLTLDDLRHENYGAHHRQREFLA